MASATIKLFLPHGDPKRLRTAEISNWSGKALAAPRTEFDDLLGREELTGSGIYILLGADPVTQRLTAYIGEGESLAERLKSHKSKDFWNQAVAFVSKDENLTKSHIRYLEGRLIEEATKAGRYALDNAKASGSKLPEADRHDMEEFLQKIAQLLPVLGSELLTPASGSLAVEAAPTLSCAVKGLTAKGRRTENGFVVLADSQAVGEVRPSAAEYAAAIVRLREQYLADGTLVREDGHLRFTKDTEFSSPSAAAALIVGGTANGLTAWKTAKGRTLQELEAAHE
jgi:hypothetical protein